MFKSTSTPVFGFLGGLIDALTEDVNPRRCRTTIDELYDRPIGSNSYAPRRQTCNAGSCNCDIRVWVDGGVQSRRAYYFAVAIIDNYRLAASYRGEVNSNMSMRLAQNIVDDAINHGLDIQQNSRNGYSYINIHDNGNIVVSIRRRNTVAW